MDRGLPANEHAERLVLGTILFDDRRFGEVGFLCPGDFVLERHRRIFTRMQELQGRGEHIDYVTVAEELSRRGELEADGLSYLVSLTDGVCSGAHLDSSARIVLKKSKLRRMIFAMQKSRDECFLETVTPEEILANHSSAIEELALGGGTHIRRIEDLESVFANRVPVEYLVKPELPAKAITCLTGPSESGKTTLAYAWARDVHLQGHAVLILDRDKNPRDRICDRLERLGIGSKRAGFVVWDCQQKSEAPQPNHPIIVDWMKRVEVATGKSPLVIADSLISFFSSDEDENSAADMRAVFDRLRVLTSLGATVLVIHHPNRNGEARGSSDFKPAGDQAFLVSNHDRAGGRLLDEITLKCEKSRYGFSGKIKYHYCGGKMLRVGEHPDEEGRSRLISLLNANQGVGTGRFEKLAMEQGLKREPARAFLQHGASAGIIAVQERGRGRLHHWRGSEVNGNDGTTADRAT
jgi:hypothetical protein